MDRLEPWSLVIVDSGEHPLVSGADILGGILENDIGDLEHFQREGQVLVGLDRLEQARDQGCANNLAEKSRV